MRTCLVTGGAGFIGCAIAEALVASFDRVVALDNLHPQVHPAPVRPAALHPAVELVRGDITLPVTWTWVLGIVRPTVIVHLAAETGTGQSLTEASRHAAVNLVGTTRMMDALAATEALPERIVLASSRAVYGEGAWRDQATGAVRYPGQRGGPQLARSEWDFPGLEPLPAAAADTHPAPSSVYGATKLGQENVLRAWAQSFGVEIGILRLQNVYGPGQSLINAYTGIVSLFAQWAREGRSIPVFEDGRVVRDFVFIDDVAAAVARLATGPVPSALPYDVGSGIATSVLGLATILAQRYGAPPPHVTGRYRNGDVRHAACSIARTVADLDWRPRTPLAEGLERLVASLEGERGLQAA